MAKQELLNRLRPWAGLLLAYIALNSTGCASYHLGNQFLYRGDIRSVHVVMFESDSNRRYLGQRMTEAVIKELEQKTPLTITEPQITDSFIRGRIIQDTKRVVGENRFDEPRSLDVNWVVEIDWVDRAGTPLMQRQTIRISEDAVFIPEGGQSISTAQQAVIERTARQIVSQMQTPW